MRKECLIVAQLRDSTIDGNLEVTGDIILKTNDMSIKGVHPDTGGITDMLHLSVNGNTVVGYDGYKNKSGNTYIYGNDVAHYVASANANFRPYYRAGDTISFTGNSAVRTAGYVTNAGKNSCCKVCNWLSKYNGYKWSRICI